MRCAVCWFLPSGRIYTTATMIVNGQSVCDRHADVAYRFLSIAGVIDSYDNYMEAVNEKAEDDAIEARRVGY